MSSSSATSEARGLYRKISELEPRYAAALASRDAASSAAIRAQLAKGLGALLLTSPEYALLKQVRQKLWHLFYRPISQLRHDTGPSLKVAPLGAPKALLDVVEEACICFGSLIEATLAHVATVADSNVAQHNVNMAAYLGHVGDLLRYRHAASASVELPASVVALVCPVGASEPPSPAMLYLAALRLEPGNGRFQNQIALSYIAAEARWNSDAWLAVHSIYHYLRALQASQPCSGSAENIMQLFDSMRRVQRAIAVASAPVTSSMASASGIFVGGKESSRFGAAFASAPSDAVGGGTNGGAHRLPADALVPLSPAEQARVRSWANSSAGAAVLRSVEVMSIAHSRVNIDKLDSLLPATLGDWAQSACISDANWMRAHGNVLACSLLLQFRALSADTSVNGVLLAVHVFHLIVSFASLALHRLFVLLDELDSNTAPLTCPDQLSYLTSCAVVLDMLSTHEFSRAFVQQVHSTSTSSDAHVDEDWKLFRSVLQMTSERLYQRLERSRHLPAPVASDETPQIDEETGETIFFRGLSATSAATSSAHGCDDAPFPAEMWACESERWRALALEGV
jgi:hypothetical protein